MENNIIKKLEDTLLKEEKKYQNDTKLASFEQASIEIEKLVKSGLLKKRGYNLMTIERKHLNRFSINSNLF